MKFIHEDSGQVIEVRGRKFYYPPWDQWIEDRYLPKYPPEKLAGRFGIYRLVEKSYDKQFYKTTGFTDTKEGTTITRTYSVESKWTPQQIFDYRIKEAKRDGIRLFAQAVRVEPILELTGDDMDLVVYKRSIRDAFVAFRNTLASLRDDNTLGDYERYEAMKSAQPEWPDPPIEEDVWEVYRDNA